MSATVVSPSTTATADMIGVSDLGPLIARLHSLLARVSSGEVVAPPAFEQRLFGGLIAQLTARPAPSPRSPRGERQRSCFPPRHRGQAAPVHAAPPDAQQCSNLPPSSAPPAEPERQPTERRQQSHKPDTTRRSIHFTRHTTSKASAT